MSKITPTAARIVKKGLWKDINRWVKERSLSEGLDFDSHNKRKRMPRMLAAFKKHQGDLYAGSILLEGEKYPGRNKLIVLNWAAYVESKRLAILPAIYDSKLECEELRGVALTEHAIERMAERLGTLDRKEILLELAAVAMPACFLIWGDSILPEHEDYFAVKTPHGIGVLVVDDTDDEDISVYLVTWISNEEVSAPKFQKIEWELFPQRQKNFGVWIKIDIPAGAKMFLPHELSREWARQVIAEDRSRGIK